MKSYNEFSLLDDKPVETKEYVTLKQLMLLPNSGGKKVWTVKCEVLDVSPRNFREAVRNYNPYDNKLVANKNENTRSVYNIRLLLRDASLPETGVFDAHIFSWDGKGDDFLPEVNIQDISVSSLKSESKLYEERIQRLLEETTEDTPV